MKQKKASITAPFDIGSQDDIAKVSFSKLPHDLLDSAFCSQVKTNFSLVISYCETRG
jgi:hypothetical protein